MDGCDRNTRDAGRAESSHIRLLTGTRGGGQGRPRRGRGGEEGSQAWLRQKHAGREEGHEGSHGWLLTGTKGAAKDGCDGDTWDAGPWG